MKWTVLTDNRTDHASLKTEHGLAILLETSRHKILLDTGASEVILQNAQTLGIDLSTVDYIFLSHGHNDHTGGLRHILSINTKAKVIVAPSALSGLFYSKRNHLHSITNDWPELTADRLVTIDKDTTLDDDLHIMAHIPHNHATPQGNQNLFIKNATGDYVPDDFRHELALYTEGLLFTGCAHSGLENILSACPWPVNMVVGGYHLLDGYESEQELTCLASRLIETYPNTQFYTSHCTGDKAFSILHLTMGPHLHAFRLGNTISVSSPEVMA